MLFIVDVRESLSLLRVLLSSHSNLPLELRLEYFHIAHQKDNKSYLKIPEDCGAKVERKV
jgi:hypothetical protein